MPRHNPEKRSWKGRSYKKGGEPVKELREKQELELCYDSFGGLDVCYLEKGHTGNHVGMDCTWRPDADENMGYDTLEEKEMDREQDP